MSPKSSEVETNAGGIVFLDVDVVWHSDFKHLGIKAVATSENYFSTIDAGLSQIAEELGYKDVIVAAHPRSDYDNKPNTYSFPILKDVTFELIKKASVVVSHDSTALSWAIIMRKPIILVTTDELYKNYTDRMSIDTFAFLLGKEVVNLNRIPNKYEWEAQLLVDETKYRN